MKAQECIKAKCELLAKSYVSGEIICTDGNEVILFISAVLH